MHRLLHVSPLQRRLVVIPAVLALTALTLVASPLLAVIAVVFDIVTGPRRMRASRLLMFGLNYLFLESAAVMAGFALWIMFGFGLALRSSPSMRLHAAVERWWVTSVMSATQRWMGTDVHVEGLQLIRQGPMVIIAQHASFFDAVLPAVLLAWAEADSVPRYTLKRELLLSPALDIFGHRLTNHFVDRTPVIRAVELDGFSRLAHDLGNDSMVVFPEGTFHTTERSVRAVDRVRSTNPERASRLARLDHVLPLRPGGVSALLTAAPHVDLVIIGHHGFGPFGSMKSILKNLPFREPVRVRLWRVDADALPEEEADRLRFLDDQWSAMDQWITDTVAQDDQTAG